MLRVRAVVLASALILAPLGARGADLVVWWEQGFYAQEDAAVAEIIAAFEQKTGKQVELVQPTQDELPNKAQAALEAGQPPDFLFGTSGERWVAQWAYEDRLSTSRASSPRSSICSMPTRSTRPPCSTARRADAASMPCRWAGIPTTSMSGTASWSGPASRSPTFPRSGRRSGRSGATRCSPPCARPLGRDDIWGVGLPMSAAVRRHRRRAQAVPARVRAPWLGLDRRLQSTTRPCGRGSSRRWTPTRRSGARAARRPTRRTGPTSTTTRRSSPRPS